MWKPDVPSEFEIFPELHLFLPLSTAIAIDHGLRKSIA